MYAEKRVVRKIFVPFEEHAEQNTPTLDRNDEENIMYVRLNKGAIKDTLHAWISVTLRISISQTDMY